MEYKISILKDSDRIPELVTLFRTGLGETTEAFWKWRLFTENGQPDQPFAIVASESDTKIVGMISVLPVRYWDGKNYLKCAQIGDWVILKELRGKGIAHRMFDYVNQYLSEQSFDFFIGFPNQYSYPVLKKYGFQDLSGVTCWNSRNKLFLRKPNYKEEISYNGVVYKYSEHYLDMDLFLKQEGRIYKNKEFLQWKYDLNPDEKYTWLSLWQDERCIGYFIYMCNKGRIRTAVNVYDWEYIGTDFKYFQHAIRLLRKEGNFVSFWGRYSIESKQLLQKAGLYDNHENIVCIVKPVGEGTIPELTLTRIDTDY